MFVTVDLCRLPVRVTLSEPDDFGSLEVRIMYGQHVWLEVAARHGWIGPDGAIRAHVVAPRSDAPS